MDREAAAAAIEAFLRALDLPVDTDRELGGTGARVTSLYADELLDGYARDVRTILAAGIPAVAPPMVIIERLATHVVCPHHLTLGRGFASVLYQPSDRVVGLGAIAELVDACTHRLILQEDAGGLVARALVDHLGARGAACVLSLRHDCLEHHGVKQRARVRTLSFAGTFVDESSDRAAALAAIASMKQQKEER